MLASGKEEGETARYAALTIANIACDSANQEKIVVDGGGTMLVRLLRSSDADLIRHSARALANLAWNSVCRDKLGSQSNCISWLCRMLCSADSESARYAAGAIANLAYRHPHNQVRVGRVMLVYAICSAELFLWQERITNEPGVFTSLYNLLGCQDAESIRYAVRGVANLARGAGRTSLCSQPGMLLQLQVCGIGG
jgi:hypothetical protein